MFYKDDLHDTREASDGINETNDEEVSGNHAATELKEEKAQNESPTSGFGPGGGQGAAQQDVYYAYARDEGSTVDQPYRPMYSHKFNSPIVLEAKESCEFIQNNWHHVLHLPYLPFLSRPGWFLRYVYILYQQFLILTHPCGTLCLSYVSGLIDAQKSGSSKLSWFQSICMDFFSGVTVAITLIPQV